MSDKLWDLPIPYWVQINNDETPEYDSYLDSERYSTPCALRQIYAFEDDLADVRRDVEEEAGVPFKRETRFVGHRTDIERLITEHVGVTQSLRPSLDDDCNVEFYTVDADRWSAESYDEFLPKMSWHIELVLCYLAFKGIINEGDYMIHGSSWMDGSWNYDDMEG